MNKKTLIQIIGIIIIIVIAITSINIFNKSKEISPKVLAETLGPEYTIKKEKMKYIPETERWDRIKSSKCSVLAIYKKGTYNLKSLTMNSNTSNCDKEFYKLLIPKEIIETSQTLTTIYDAKEAITKKFNNENIKIKKDPIFKNKLNIIYLDKNYKDEKDNYNVKIRKNFMNGKFTNFIYEIIFKNK